MEEKKFVSFKKEELQIREFIKTALGKGRVNNVEIEYTPVGEKIIVWTERPGFIIGKQGGRINDLTVILKKKFKLENPHIDISEIYKPEFDAQSIADIIALGLERFGNMKFKALAYKELQRVMRAGALGAEMRISGKLPGERAKCWRFAQGYLKKTGNTAKVVHRAQAVAKTKSGTIGIKVAILPPDAKIHDQIHINDDIIKKVESNYLAQKGAEIEKAEKEAVKKKRTKKTVKPQEKEEKSEDGNTKE